MKMIYTKPILFLNQSSKNMKKKISQQDSILMGAQQNEAHNLKT